MDDDETLQSLILWSREAFSGQKVWDDLLTAAERLKLGGDFQSAFVRLGTIGIWTELHGGLPQEALLDIGVELNLISERFATRLLQIWGLATENGSDTRVQVERPVWNFDTRTLSLGGKKLREVRAPKRARNIVAILNVFEEERWPERIDDPLTNGPNFHRLHRAIANLNRGLTGIRFRADGTGEGISWSPV